MFDSTNIPFSLKHGNLPNFLQVGIYHAYRSLLLCFHLAVRSDNKGSLFFRLDSRCLLILIFTA